MADILYAKAKIKDKLGKYKLCTLHKKSKRIIFINLQRGPSSQIKKEQNNKMNKSI